MPKIIEVVYENGVFRPLEKVELKEGERVRIKIEDQIENKKIKREYFLQTWKPIKLDKELSLDEIKILRLKKYGEP